MEWLFDQAHLGVPDPVAAAEWYRRYLGADAGDHVDRVMFGDTRVIFLKNETPAPSHGSAIDHLALSYPDLDARVKALDGSGAIVVSPIASVDGLYRSATIDDPWGARIELVEMGSDPGDELYGGQTPVRDDSRLPRFHHVHIRVPEVARSQAWYVDTFGATRGRFKGRLDGIECGGMWVVMDRGPAAPSKGHTIDHIGWRMADLRATAAELKQKGVTFTTEPQPGPSGPHAPVLLSFTEDPWGVKIELLQRP
jgi:catechol 2,3-dioxygenase-like lactoylglutathione lyase family enzyme